MRVFRKTEDTLAVAGLIVGSLLFLVVAAIVYILVAIFKGIDWFCSAIRTHKTTG